MGLECAIWRLTPDQLDQLLDSDEAVGALLCDEENAIEADYIDLEKCWHSLHFLLTGSAETDESPLSLAIMVGYPIAEDYIDGARFLLPDDVKEVAEALSALSEKDLRERYDSEAMKAAEVYRGGWGGEELEVLIEFFKSLKKFYLGAAQEGNAVLCHIG